VYVWIIRRYVRVDARKQRNTRNTLQFS